MKIHINGEVQECEDQLALKDLLKKLHVKKEGVAIALNFKVIESDTDVQLKEGDKLDILTMVSGG